MSDGDKREQQERRPADVRAGPAAADAPRHRRLDDKTVSRAPDDKMLKPGRGFRGYETK